MKISLRILAALTSSATSVSAQDDSADDLAKQLSNPIASLISVPFQSNFDFRMGPLDDGWKFTLNFQPVVPVSLNDDWNLIVRTIVPFVHQEDIYKKIKRQDNNQEKLAGFREASQSQG